MSVGEQVCCSQAKFRPRNKPVHPCSIDAGERRAQNRCNLRVALTLELATRSAKVGIFMRKLTIAALLLISCQFVAAPRLSALDRAQAQPPRQRHLTTKWKSRWVPMYGESRFKIADDMIATLFVEKGSLVEYKQTGVWPEGSSFLLRLKQIPVTEKDGSRQPSLVMEIKYKNNPVTQQWESYAMSWRYDRVDVKKPYANCRTTGMRVGCSQRPIEETVESGADFL